jgi:hypothetical protein
MIKNGDLPAMPQNNSEALCRQTGMPHYAHSGLTKREMFAMAAMQGLLSADADRVVTEIEIADWSVRQADALLAVLERTK